MGISQGVAANLPSLYNIRRTVRLQRSANEENLPPLPAARDIIPILPAMYQTNSTDEQFFREAIFLGGNSPGGNSPGGNSPGGEFPGGKFPEPA